VDDDGGVSGVGITEGMDIALMYFSPLSRLFKSGAEPEKGMAADPHQYGCHSQD
jgi:hypothetical protein